MNSAAGQPEFRRARHLLFSCLGLLHGPLVVRMGELLPLLVSVPPLTAPFDALGRLIALCFAALVAYLAFEIFATHSGVTVLPRRWSELGVLGVGAFAARELATLLALWQAPPELFVYDRPFRGGGWFVGALVFGYAFQRTRSLAVPVLMHSAHNILVITLAWSAR